MSINNISLSPGTVVSISGGTHVGHTARILSVTNKMYHVQLDNNTVTKVKKTNVQTLSAHQLQSHRRFPDYSTGISHQASHKEPSSGDSEANRTAENLSQKDLTRQIDRLECKRKIAEALEEIHRQASIVAELSDQLQVLNLMEDSRPCLRP